MVPLIRSHMFLGAWSPDVCTGRELTHRRAEESWQSSHLWLHLRPRTHSEETREALIERESGDKFVNDSNPTLGSSVMDSSTGQREAALLIQAFEQNPGATPQ